ncbi:glycosyltransferase family 4 protein [Haloferax sp. YSMS24]|uniref:glycosyltransferase family 4 protein n=1 Tax=Haloferax sp. YSMS24 TaxID=3388425 RepID=UPI00398D21A5
MKIALFPKAYPSEELKYNYAFVHRRAVHYAKQHDVQVFLPNKHIGINYDFEGIPVKVRKPGNIVSEINEYDPDILFVHAPVSRWEAFDFSMLSLSEEVQSRTDIPIITWLHGFEAISRLLYYPSDLPAVLDDGVSQTLKTLFLESTRNARNIMQLKNMRGYLRRRDRKGDITVFVSEWLRGAVENSTKRKVKNAQVVPNPIDEELFSYTERKPSNRNKLLSIRSFNSRKYANDLSIRAISKLNEGHLDIYGQGKYLSKCRQLSDDLGANVTFNPTFLKQEQIADLHDEYGIYLSPSRTDAQGVSMCEAMASGLPVITSPIGGIPEFVTDGKTGYLCETPEEMTNRISLLQSNPDQIVSMGERAAAAIRRKCGTTRIIEKELDIAKSLM